MGVLTKTQELKTKLVSSLTGGLTQMVGGYANTGKWSGKDFLKGAATSLIITNLNHLAHNKIGKLFQEGDPVKKDKGVMINKKTVADNLLRNPKSNGGGFMAGFGIKGILGGGISLSLGYVEDSLGNRGIYFTFGGSTGLSAQIGPEIHILSATHSGPILLSHIRGVGYGNSLVIGPFGGSYSGTVNDSKYSGIYIFQNIGSHKQHSQGYRTITPSLDWGTSSRAGFDFSITKTKTWIWEL